LNISKLKNIILKIDSKIGMEDKNITKLSFSDLKIMNKIDFYNCWEDILQIEKALKINSNDVVFSITSNGCNILNLLLHNPKKIISVDFNPFQNYLLELKITAIKNLEYLDFLKLMGLKSLKNNLSIYNSIKKDLNKNARNFWDKNSFVIKKGLLNVGEQNVKNFGLFLRFLKGEKLIKNFFLCETIKEQTDYFFKHIYGMPWQLGHFFGYNKYFIRISLCFRFLIEFYHGRKKSDYLGYIKNVNFTKNHIKKIEDIYTKIPIKYNSFLSLILLGYLLNENHYYPYLKQENYKILKERIKKIEIKTASVFDTLKEIKDNSISKFFLSNIFDWIDDKNFKKNLIEIIRVGKNKSRIFYSITRKDRYIPKDILEFHQDKNMVIELLKNDRTTFYSGFEVGDIRKK